MSNFRKDLNSPITAAVCAFLSLEALDFISTGIFIWTAAGCEGNPLFINNGVCTDVLWEKAVQLKLLAALFKVIFPAVILQGVFNKAWITALPFLWAAYKITPVIFENFVPVITG